MSIAVRSTVKSYEVDGKEASIGTDAPTVEVRSHWNNAGLVVLVVDGKRWTFSADDLRAAVANAQNTARR